jgi:microcystin-dependent protein
MPRNGSGSYSLPEAAFVPNTAISSAAVNSDFSDIGDALTASLARNGEGGMTAVLPLANTGFTYLTDPNTGMRRTGADTQAISGGGVDTVTITPTGVSVAGTLAVSGALTVGGAPLLPVGLGPLPWSGTTAPAKWVLANGQTLLRADYPDLWTFAAAEIALGNTLYTNGNGTTTFTVADMCGRVSAGADNIGGIARKNRLTSTTITPDATVYGAISSNTSQTVTLSLAQLPAGIASTGVTSNTIVVTGPNSGDILSKTITGTPVSFSAGSDGYFRTNSASFSGSNNITSNVTSNNTGGTAHSNVQPTIITNYIIYAGA